MRKAITAAVVVALAAAGALVAAPAEAGEYWSPTCNNGVGNETPLLTWPVTLGVQRNADGSVYVCYSTTPQGSPGGVGGMLWVIPSSDVSTVTVRARVVCYPDIGAVVAPACDTNTNGASVGSPSYGSGSTTYVSDTGGPCLWVLGTQYLSTCSSRVSATYYASDGPGISTPSTGVCLLSAGSTCHAYLSGVKVTSGNDSTKPLLSVESPHGKRDVDAPLTCHGVLAACP